MAVNRTGAMFKSLTFDGEDSRDYGVYITGQAVFNAPEREVEMISIPGRNGQFALDKGRFENIEVTYPAGIFANTEAEFAEAVSNFRNLLCSKRGYVRLQDEYHPDEYRMAIYKSGLELENVALKAGEFEITFDCKPQRYLTSGEEENIVVNGGTLTNPTRFDAEPLLEVKGYGTIEFNGYEIELEDGYVGTVSLFDQTFSGIKSITFDQSMMNTGDDITLTGSFEFSFDSGSTINYATSTNPDFNISYSGVIVTVTFSINLVTGTTSSVSTRISAEATKGGITNNRDYDVVLTYTSNGQTAVFDYSMVTALTQRPVTTITCSIAAIGDSTVWKLGNPTYIDCELGECYMYNNGELVSLNAYIDLGSDLPKLAPGGNEFTIDNTITELKVVPKWWKV